MGVEGPNLRHGGTFDKANLPTIAEGTGPRFYIHPEEKVWKPMLGMTKSVVDFGEAGGRKFVEKSLGKTAPDWATRTIPDTNITYGALYKAAEEVINKVKTAPKINTKLVRGISPPFGVKSLRLYEELKPGDTLKMPVPSSFSSDQAVANIHAQGERSYFIVTEGPVRALDMKPYGSTKEFEFVSNGPFKVKSVENIPNGKRIVVTQE